MAHGAAASNRPAARRGFPDPAGRPVPYRWLLRARRPRSVTRPDKRRPLSPAACSRGPASRRAGGPAGVVCGMQKATGVAEEPSLVSGD